MNIGVSVAVWINVTCCLAATTAHAGSMAQTAAGAEHADAAVWIGDIEISGAYAKPMLPGQPVGGGYLVIRNGGSGSDRLLSAESAVAGAVEIHEMAMDGETMRMRKLKDGLAVPAGAALALKPGGLHLMFMKVRTSFKQGDTIPLRLVFEKAGEAQVTMPVTAVPPAGEF